MRTASEAERPVDKLMGPVVFAATGAGTGSAITSGVGNAVGPVGAKVGADVTHSTAP